MPTVFLVLALLGLVFFGVRLVADLGSWVTDAVGVVASVLLGARQVTVLRPARKVAVSPRLREVRDQPTLKKVLASERAILYKHSTQCPVSDVVINEVLRAAETHPEWELYLLKVIEHRDLSNAVAEQLSVPHASPQVFVLRGGRLLWHSSHYKITSHSLSAQLA